MNDICMQLETVPTYTCSMPSSICDKFSVNRPILWFLSDIQCVIRTCNWYMQITKHTRYCCCCDCFMCCSYWSKSDFLLECDSCLSPSNMCSSDVLNDLVFSTQLSSVYTHTKHLLHGMAETLEHRILRLRHLRRTEQQRTSTALSPLRVLSYKLYIVLFLMHQKPLITCATPNYFSRCSNRIFLP